MLTAILVGGAILLIFWYYAIKPMNYWRNKGVKQGNPVWVLGDNWKSLLKMESFTETFQRLYAQQPDERYCGIYQFTLPTLMVRDPELLKQITVKEFEHFVDHNSLIPEEVDPLWTKNLFSLKGQRWREMRPILSPSFTSSKMKSMFILMTECVEVFVQHFQAKKQDLIEVDLKDIFTRFGNDIIASAAFGIKVDSLAQPNNEFYAMGKAATDFNGFWKSLKFFGYFVIPSLYRLFKVKLFDQTVSKFFLNLVDETIRVREEQNIIRPDMIHLLMEARKGNNKHEEDGIIETGFATVEEADIGKADTTSKSKDITNMDIAAQALIFFFGGFDSVTTLMSFLTMEVAIHTDVQDKLREEIEDTKASCGGKITYEALMKMKYMDMVVSEALRKWPTASVSDRACTKPYTIQPKSTNEQPLHLEKGAIVTIPIYAFHHDPKYFPNPDKFDPERFSDENKANIQPYTYLPFGLGPRNCIGSRFALLETKIMLFYLLSEFELVPTKKTVAPIKLKKTIGLLAEGGFNIGFKRINKK